MWVSITIGGTIGGWVGAAMDHNNWFGLPSILLGGVGSILGIWAAYIINRDYL